MTPKVKVAPLGGAHAKVAPGQLSAKDVLKGTTVPGGPAHSTVILVEQLMAGASLSLIVTVKVQPFVLPEASVARQLTVVTPLMKVELLDGVQRTVAPGQLSVVVDV